MKKCSRVGSIYQVLNLPVVSERPVPSQRPTTIWNPHTSISAIGKDGLDAFLFRAAPSANEQINRGRLAARVSLREPPIFAGLRALQRAGCDVAAAETCLVRQSVAAGRALDAQIPAVRTDAQSTFASSKLPALPTDEAKERAAVLAVVDTGRRSASLEASARLQATTAQVKRGLRQQVAQRRARETEADISAFRAHLPLGIGAAPHVWTPAECAAFEKALLLHGTDFGQVSRGVLAATQREARLEAEAEAAAGAEMSSSSTSSAAAAAAASSSSAVKPWVCGVQDAVLYYYGIFKQLPGYPGWKAKRKKLRDDAKLQLTAWFHRPHREVNNETLEEQLEGEERNDSCCSVCEDGGELICCEGVCRRVFHSKCVGMTEAELASDEPWLCKECTANVFECFICGESGAVGVDVFSCERSCGKYFHTECVLRDWRTQPLNWNGINATVPLAPILRNPADGGGRKRSRSDAKYAESSSSGGSGSGSTSSSCGDGDGDDDDGMVVESSGAEAAAKRAKVEVSASAGGATVEGDAAAEPKAFVDQVEEDSTRRAAWKVAHSALVKAREKTPFKSGGITVLSFGSVVTSPGWHDAQHIWPIGFKSERKYGAGTVGGKRQQVLYTSEILRIDGTAAPIFRVTASNAQDEPCEGATASAAWDAMFKRVSAAKAAEGAPHAIHSKANGSMMFGLSERHEAIVGVVEGLEDALECASYVFRSMRTPIIALGARASVPPARSRRRTARRSYEAAGAALFANRFVCPYHACQECGTALDGTSETGLARGDGKPIPFVRCFHCPTSYCMTCEPDATVEIMTDGGVIRCPASKEQHVADREAAAAARSARRAALDEVRRSVKPRYEAQIEAAEVEAKRAAAADKATAAAAAAGDARTAADAAPQKVVTPSDESSAMEVETTAATSAAAPAVALTLSPRVSAGKRAAASGAGFGGVLVSRRAKKKAQPKLHEREQDHGRFIRSLKAALSETEWKQWERVMKMARKMDGDEKMVSVLIPEIKTLLQGRGDLLQHFGRFMSLEVQAQLI